MSEPITFRIPLELWGLLEHNASNYERTPAEHVQIRLIESLEAQMANSTRATPPTGCYDGDCGHPRARVINGGLHHCDECDSTRGVDGFWRAKQ